MKPFSVFETLMIYLFMDMQNAGQALFAVPNPVLATALNIPIPILQIFKNNFSPALLQTNVLSGCLPLA
jgi:hypothetical protein